VGNLTLNRSLLNLRAGAMGRVSAAVAGAATFGTLAAGSGLLGYVPRPLLGGLLLYMALALLGRWLVESRRRLSPADYALVVVIFFTIIQWGYLAGVVLGTVAACISFAVRYSRVRVIRREVTGAEFGSHVQWSPDQERALRAHGARIRVLWLQGFLFFGTANTLLEALRRRLDSPQPAGWLLLDFAGVQGLDSSAVFSFVKLRHLAEARGLTLVLSRLRPPLEAALRAEGAIDESSPCCRVAGDLDRALEWCEARLLEHVAPQADAEDRFAPWLAGEMGDPGHFARLLERLDPVLVPAGGTLFYQGAAPDAVYFIRLGRVSVLLTTPHAPAALRLRSMVGCTVVGEMGFYREVIRTASVVADEPTLAYRLSARTLERIHREDPELAASFHRLMVRLVADRLAFANQEVAALSR
jgi:SulP family sulfate permease